MRIILSPGKSSFPLLGDFGAATTFNKTDKALAKNLEALEVRAFGCLLEDLLDHLDPKWHQNETTEILVQLKSDCLAENPENRPDLLSIKDLLLDLSN